MLNKFLWIQINDLRIRSQLSRRKCGNYPKPPGLRFVHEAAVEQRIVQKYGNRHKSSLKLIQTLVLVRRGRKVPCCLPTHNL